MGSFKIIIVNGRPGCGKTTFESLCQRELGEGFCKIRSSIDCIKEIAKMGGWDGNKDLKSRKFLSDLKYLFVKYNNYPFNDILNFIRQWEDDLRYYKVLDKFHLLFIDVREPDQIQYFKDYFGDNIKTLLIQRKEVEKEETSNQSDAAVFNYNYDYIIYNNGTIEDLNNKVKAFLTLIQTV